jgi:Fe-Mn family superoxide dismutase
MASIELPDLPFPLDALEPHISKRTMEFHHGKHHATYVKTANGLVKGTPYEKMNLPDIIRASFGKPDERAIFNNTAQVWNHTFFWQCMRPGGGGEPEGVLAKRLQAAFGSHSEFRKKFSAAATGRFGSGWAWLVLDNGKLSVTSTPNAENPLVNGQVPLLTCDVWEHAYYLDYQNQRQSFVDAFLGHLVNWNHVESCLREADATTQGNERKRATARG